MAEYLQHPSKIDERLEAQAGSVDGVALGRLHWLVYGVLRHWRRLRDAVRRQVPKAPRPMAEAAIILGFYELWADQRAEPAKIVDFVTEQAKNLLSAAEASFVHAVLRRAPATWPETDNLALQASHPDWLYARWSAQFGDDAAARLMAWDQQAPDLWIQLAPGVTPPADWVASPWENFYHLPTERSAFLPLIQQGQAYVQDPSTRLPAQLAQVQPGQKVLDLCAAPGGKTWQLLQSLAGQGVLVSLDVPSRLPRLTQNLQNAQIPFAEALAEGHLRLGLVAADVLETKPEDLRAGQGFDVVVLDAPCSNTGVLRRRPDAKWRLSPEAIAQAAELQGRMIARAAVFVAPGGALIYSTCSVEPEENEQIVAAFLASRPDFALADQRISRPDLHGHDGGGAFRLTRS